MSTYTVKVSWSDVNDPLVYEQVTAHNFSPSGAWVTFYIKDKGSVIVKMDKVDMIFFEGINI